MLLAQQNREMVGGTPSGVGSGMTQPTEAHNDEAETEADPVLANPIKTVVTELLGNLSAGRCCFLGGGLQRRCGPSFGAGRFS